MIVKQSIMAEGNFRVFAAVPLRNVAGIQIDAQKVVMKSFAIDGGAIVIKDDGVDLRKYLKPVVIDGETYGINELGQRFKIG